MNKLNVDLIDFHTHILPGVDHGSDSVKTSRAQIELAASFGVRRIFATSHFYPDRHTVTQFLEKRERAFSELKNSGELAVDIRLGAEVLLCENLHKLDGLSELCIKGTNVLLLELPFTSLTDGMIHAVKRLTELGFEVVLAHADRYSTKRIESLLRFNTKIQLNADSLARIFKNKQLYSWMDRGLVVGLGSDIHGTSTSAYKSFLKATEKIGMYAEYVKKESDKIWERALQ